MARVICFTNPMIRLIRAAFAALAFLTLALQAAVAPRQPARQSAGEVLAWGWTQGNQPMTVSHLGQVRAIAQGHNHRLALTTDGKIWAWGFNNFGQLGDGSNTTRDVPVQVANMANAVAIAAGDSHSLALTSDGKVWAWGVKEELGNGAIADSNLPVPVNGLSGVVSIAASGVHSLALTADGRVWAWGTSSFGELGNGSLGGSDVPVLVTNLTGVVAIAAGNLQSLAITDDGKVWAWGFVGDKNWSAVPIQVSHLNGVIAIAAGYRHNVALTADGKVWAWGENDSGQLGNGSVVKSYTPVQVSNLSGVIAIACGDRHNLALTSDGKVWTWGVAGGSQLVPVRIDDLDGIASIAAGGDNSLALKAQATAWTWGRNREGELGDGTQTGRKVPTPVKNLRGIVAEAAGNTHNLALTADGKVWAWGQNYAGQLGNGGYADSSIPVAVSNLSGVKAVAAGASHSLALTADGRVWAWGQNQIGQLGNGTFDNSDIPVPVIFSGMVVAIATGQDKSLALTSDGRLWVWGNDPYGQLANGNSASYSAIPVLVSNLHGVISVAAGGSYSLALTSDGRVWSWGANTYGELGTGSDSGSSVPVMVNLNEVVAISAAVNHNFALTSDGRLWGWGYNGTGDLGDGANVGRNAPVEVKNLRGVIGFAGSAFHSLAIDSAGDVWTWGVNVNGELGTGNDAETSNVPVQISMHNALAVAAGDMHSVAIGIAAEDGSAPSASVQGIDSTTQGNWKGHYGADGYLIANDSNNPPSYATVDINGASLWTWATATTDPRALLRGASPTNRIASTYYSASSFTFDVNITGGPHQIALYLLDLDNAGRNETISILDPATNNVLDTRTFSDFRNGVYASWMLQGHVLIKVANNGGLNAVVSGLFFGNAPPAGVPAPVVSITSPAAGNVSGTITLTANATSPAGIASVQFQMNGTNAGTVNGAGPVFSTTLNTTLISNGLYSVVAIATDNLGQHTTSGAVAITISNGGVGTPAATFVKFDTTTGGTWTGVYGQNGFEIANSPGTWPIYGGVSTDSAKTWTWAASTTDPRALQQGVSSTARIASAYYSGTSFTLDVMFRDTQAHRVALYCLDMESDERRETISILDPVTHAVLDSRNVSHFHNGVYVVWDLQGRVLIQVTVTGGLNAVVSGVFFGSGSPVDTPPPTVSFIAPPAGPVSGEVSLNAHATSAAGIVSTTFVLDNTITLKEPFPGPGAFNDIDFGLSWYSATVINGPHTLTAIATDPLGQTGSATINIEVNNAAPSASLATFLGKDTTTLGNWKGHYGQDGQIIANDANNLPSYATAAWTGASQFSWSLTQDPRALQQTLGSARTASTFYLSNSSGDFSLDLNLTDGKTHQVALYFLDWDHSNRAEGVSIFDAETQYTLDSRVISGFEQGAYLVWNMTGHVTIRIQGSYGVVSGVFIGPLQ